MGEVYPELTAKAGFIHEVTETEERRFLETIEGGLRRLDEIFASGARAIPGDEAFRLYDTFGFPIDLTQIIAGERGVTVDLAGFERALEEQRQRSRSARAGTGGGAAKAPAVHTKKGGWRSVRRGKQKFVGYETTDAETDVLAFRQEGPRVELVLKENPFYVESGGQVSDVGGVSGDGWSLAVDAVRKDAKGTVVGGELRRGLRAHRGPRLGRRAAAARHRAQPQRHAPGPLRSPEAARPSRAAAGLAGAARAAALRLLAPRADRARGAARDRRRDQRAGSRQRPGRHARDAVSRRPRARRDGLLLREVRRRRPGGADGPVHRAVRRHARAHHRPGRAVPLHRTDRCGRGRAAHRGGNRRRRAPGAS